MKLTKPVTDTEKEEVQHLMTKKNGKNPSVYLIKHRNKIAGTISVEINDRVAFIHTICIRELYKQNQKLIQKLMASVSIRMAYQGVRSLFVLTQHEDVFYHNAHFSPVEDSRLPEIYQSYFQGQAEECRPRIYYKSLPNPWPSNPFR